MIEILKQHTSEWFESLDVTQRNSISVEYQKDKVVNDNIAETLTEESTNWLVQNFSDFIKDWIILNKIK